MKPIAIISTNDNPDYLFCLPIVARSWNLQGFDVQSVVLCDGEKAGRVRKVMDRYLEREMRSWWDLKIPESKNPNLYVQCIRMYLFDWKDPRKYQVIGDADMFIASDFLYRDFDKVNVFGHDLTGFEEIPMCYVGMQVSKWSEVMGNYGMWTDLEQFTKYKSDVWHESWGADQQILTYKLSRYGFHKINFINRGFDAKNKNYPVGRWDRSTGFRKPEGVIHDCHLPRRPMNDESFPYIVRMCEEIYPKEDWSWLHSYRKEFLSEVMEPAPITQ